MGSSLLVAPPMEDVWLDGSDSESEVEELESSKLATLKRLGSSQTTRTRGHSVSSSSSSQGQRSRGHSVSSQRRSRGQSVSQENHSTLPVTPEYGASHSRHLSSSSSSSTTTTNGGSKLFSKLSKSKGPSPQRSRSSSNVSSASTIKISNPTNFIHAAHVDADYLRGSSSDISLMRTLSLQQIASYPNLAKLDSGASSISSVSTSSTGPPVPPKSPTKTQPVRSNSHRSPSKCPSHSSLPATAAAPSMASLQPPSRSPTKANCDLYASSTSTAEASSTYSADSTPLSSRQQSPKSLEKAIDHAIARKSSVDSFGAWSVSSPEFVENQRWLLGQVQESQHEDSQMSFAPPGRGQYSCYQDNGSSTNISTSIPHTTAAPSSTTKDRSSALLPSPALPLAAFSSRARLYANPLGVDHP
uniref:ARAD1C24244p n=1 Tax=Blastobotrys adeninivorans TaxID=409370 RepID=A0A060T1W6_BLAAD